MPQQTTSKLIQLRAKINTDLRREAFSSEIKCRSDISLNFRAEQIRISSDQIRSAWRIRSTQILEQIRSGDHIRISRLEQMRSDQQRESNQLRAYESISEVEQIRSDNHLRKADQTESA
ncbi:hypothetical protein F511_07554 [Dorcoceras hygrometricum]|uniref:Uncharacterized protein n=1 Tax=Dorcoceras hygrometricum TaxID=472368 RepID=A0A2Z7B4G3_9LAMI|nr:hypothetical protein F511_07554 [Dorcoceras hygrometricum]